MMVLYNAIKTAASSGNDGQDPEAVRAITDSKLSCLYNHGQMGELLKCLGMVDLLEPDKLD